MRRMDIRFDVLALATADAGIVGLALAMRIVTQCLLVQRLEQVFEPFDLALQLGSPRRLTPARRVQEARDAKIGDSRAAVRIKQHIVWLQVLVDDAVRVEVSEASHDIAKQTTSNRLVEWLP